MRSRPSPHDLAELRVRAEALAGRTLGEIAEAVSMPLDGPPARTKGLAGRLIERALGAHAGSAAEPDFPHLGIELKTVPVDPGGEPRESTFICAIRMAEADSLCWPRSTARAKLGHVLFVPIEHGSGNESMAERRVGRPRFFRPTPDQESILRADFEELIGIIGAGGADGLTAHQGRWLQVRPKAADSAARTLAPDGDGALVETGPRGLYLRRRFVSAILRDPAAMPAWDR